MTRRVESDSSEPDPYWTDDAALAAIWEGFERFLVNAYLRQRGYVTDGDPVLAKTLGR